MLRRTNNLLNIILAAEEANGTDLDRTGEAILEILDEIGARHFLEEAGNKGVKKR